MRRMMALALVIPLACAALPAHAQQAKGGPINTLQQMYDRIGSCWRNPDLPPGDPGAQITVRFSLKRNGELIGEPNITYETEYVSPEKRQMFRSAVIEALQRCIPLPISDGLGNAIAGRPIAFRFDARRMNSI